MYSKDTMTFDATLLYGAVLNSFILYYRCIEERYQQFCLKEILNNNPID